MSKLFIGFIGSILFSIATYLQLNDPDPLEWGAFYGTASILCLWSTMNEIPQVLVLGLFSFSIYLAVKNNLVETVIKQVGENGLKHIPEMLYGKGFSSMKGDYVEEARELGGILVVS